MRQLKDLGLIIAYELHGFRTYAVSPILIFLRMYVFSVLVRFGVNFDS